MAEVRVKKGQEHFVTEEGVLRRYGPGETLTVQDKALKGFMANVGDKFDVVGGGDAEEEEEEETEKEFDVKTADRKALLAEAKALGMEVDSRWGDKRLREEVASVLEELEK